jgi:hypothetical protein
MKNYFYVIGDNPYENGHGDYHTRGNGEWFATAPNVEEALKVIFGGMPFPCEATGRKLFVEGVSLPGICDEEIIQVWSNEPQAHERSHAGLKDYKGGGLHTRGHNLSLHLEIKVTDLDKYVTPARALLMAPLTPDAANTNTDISPMGASLVRFDDVKHELQAAIQREQMDIAHRQWELESVSDAMEERMKLMQQQLGVLNTYLHGTRQRTQLTMGNRGTGKYHVFQSRQFLSEEIALLGNFDDFDFKKLEDLERWLIKSGRIWKFLPFERCILATRVRQEKKDYGDPLINLINNYENMQNMIWIRDGENVCHVDVDFDFHNAVFPDRNQFDRAFQVCRNHLWRKAFKWTKPKNWHGELLKPGEYDVMGQMRRKPIDEQEPYYTQKIEKARFHTIESWLDSEFYTELLDKQLRDAVHEYLREVNRRQMVFAVLLQGIVDNTQLLDVPKGSDLFNWEIIDRYFVLLSDYTHALPWKGISDKVAPYLDGKVNKGDWIVALVDEYIDSGVQGVHGTTYKESRPVLFQVTDVVEVTLRTYLGSEGYKNTQAMRPTVNYHPIKSRRSRGEDYWSKTRTKAPVKLTLKNSDFLRVPMPPSLAQQILDDRSWKKTYRWAVPLMVNYKKIIKAVQDGENCTILRFDNCDD